MKGWKAREANAKARSERKIVSQSVREQRLAVFNAMRNHRAPEIYDDPLPLVLTAPVEEVSDGALVEPEDTVESDASEDAGDAAETAEASEDAPEGQEEPIEEDEDEPDAEPADEPVEENKPKRGRPRKEGN